MELRECRPLGSLGTRVDGMPVRSGGRGGAGQCRGREQVNAGLVCHASTPDHAVVALRRPGHIHVGCTQLSGWKCENWIRGWQTV